MKRTLSEINGIKYENYSGSLELPIVARSPSADFDLLKYTISNKDEINEILYRSGAILFKGFSVNSNNFRELAAAMSDLLDYKYRSTSRTSVDNNVYTSTEYPSDQTIAMHCENAFQRDWPTKIFFCCDVAADTGGETQLASMLNVTNDISGEIKRKFKEKKIRYIRNYRPSLDLPWQVVFQTAKKVEAERYCDENEIEFEWVDKNWLRTSQICQATAFHHVTGQEIWFNQAHLFHVSNLEPSMRDTLLGLYSESELPRNATFGDGSPLIEEELQMVRDAYKKNIILFPWERGDFLLGDNMLVAHGRSPFTGLRKIIVAMGDLYSQQKRIVF